MITVGSSNYSACFLLCGGQARTWVMPKSFACAINCGAQFIACWPCPSLSGQHGWDWRVADSERARETGGGGGWEGHQTTNPPLLPVAGRLDGEVRGRAKLPRVGGGGGR
jgi:hypothetical protein